MGFSFCRTTGKRRYATSAAAHKAIHRLAGTKTVDTGAGTLIAYCCPFCDWFHIGHDAPRRS